MKIDNCPGCCSRMVNGVCSMCGFVDKSRTVSIENERETTFEVLAEKQETVETMLSTALIDCPVCANRVSETAVNCPKCGFVFTPEFVAAQREKQDRDAKAQRAVNLVGMTLLSPFVFMLGLLLFTATQGREDDRTRMIRYCEENGIPYRIGTVSDAPRSYSTRSEQLARFHELGDKLHPTEAETREYLRLYVELSAQ